MGFFYFFINEASSLFKLAQIIMLLDGKMINKKSMVRLLSRFFNFIFIFVLFENLNVISCVNSALGTGLIIAIKSIVLCTF